MNPNIMERRLAVLLPRKLAADLKRAVSARETTLSEYVRSTLRERIAADQPMLDHGQRGERP